MAITVTGLSITPVKGTRLRAVDRIELTRDGVRENRRFYVIDERDRMLNGKQLGALAAVTSEYSDERRWLTLAFPDGRLVEGEVMRGEEITTRFYSRTVRGALVAGPWSEALSDHLERPLRLVEPLDGSAVDRGRRGAASLISRASLARLADVAGQTGVDVRRFRMLIEIDGVSPHGEDRWVRRTARVGRVLVRFGGHVGRCLVTSRDPDTGEIDLPTLDILRSYRGELDSTEPLAFGVYGDVIEPGAIRVGDLVTLDGYG